MKKPDLSDYFSIAEIGGSITSIFSFVLMKKSISVAAGMRRSVCLLLSTCPAALIACAPASAADDDWSRYDSAYFEAFSDAREKDVRNLLGELENFRRIVIELAGIKVPGGAVRTQVLIFRSKREFADTHPDRNVAAYMSTVTGIPYIVMPAGSRLSDARQSIRHEFTHVLQAYSRARIPPWYIEGFAEFMAAISFLDDGEKMILGDATGRRIDPMNLVNWDELISDDFKFHRIESAERANNAYAQAWMLVHYLTLGDELAHNANLIRYLTAYANGEPSSDAFERILGESAGRLGPRVLSLYRRKFNPLQVPFSPVDVDGEIVRSETSPDTIQRMIENLKIRNGARPD